MSTLTDPDDDDDDDDESWKPLLLVITVLLVPIPIKAQILYVVVVEFADDGQLNESVNPPTLLSLAVGPC